LPSFPNEEFTKLYKILVVKKSSSVHVEVMDGQPMSLEDVIYKTVPLKVLFNGHSNSIVFNIIETCSNPIILGLSWLEKYNSCIN